MSTNSKKKSDKKKQESKKNLLRLQQTPYYSKVEFEPFAMKKRIDGLLDKSKFTTPASIHKNVKAAAKKISSFDPVYMDCQPEPWSRQSCCDMNVAEYIKLHGGRIVCGYRLWAHLPYYIEAERHAIWVSDDETSRKDVSFSSDGEVKVLFVPDEIERQGKLEQNEPRLRFAFSPGTRQIVDILNGFENSAVTSTLDPEEAWNTMPSYEEFQAGKRMPNAFYTTVPTGQ